jgi:Ran GTPase-activating protein (RanGAP) involved in mRNA processing and transport
LSHNELGNNGMRVLAACPYLENLQVLRLADCAIGDDGLRVLAECPHLNNVVKLDLSNNPIGNTGCRALLETKHFKHLQRPIISGIGLPMPTRQALDMRFRPR